MKERSILFLLAFALSDNAVNAFLAPVVAPTARLAKPSKLHMLEGLVEPFSALAQHASAIPQLAQQMSQTLLVSPVEPLSTARLIQTAGEASFAGLFGIAAAQGAMVMKQYQNNPDGGLIVPPGLTVGSEDATNANNNGNTFSIAQEVSTKNFGLQKKAPLTEAEVEALVCDTEDSEFSCSMKKQWYHVTTQIMAIALVPLAAFAGPTWGLAAWMMRYGHIMHLAVLFGLSHIYDFFRKLPEISATYCDASKTNKCAPIVQEPIFTDDHPRVVVLGDSMCVGIGTCEVFDDQKVYDIPLHKEEHLAASEEEYLKTSVTLPGPIFPKVLAKTLSQRFQKPVAWRSAGVDGGSTLDIAEHLMGVVQDEVDKGQAPDLVVVLTGSNDLKHLLDGSASVKGFRSNLMSLAKEIQTISPKTKVVFPALPTYRMDKQSILNVFPLSVFLDSFMGVWDAQKRTAADKVPGVMHVDLTVAEVNNWYKVDEGQQTLCGGDPAEVSLIAADGIHPNARCYEKWGEFVGNSLADQIAASQNPSKSEPEEPLLQNHQPAYAGGFHTPAAFGISKQHQ